MSPGLFEDAVNPVANPVQSATGPGSKPASTLDDLAGGLAGAPPPAAAPGNSPYVEGRHLDEKPGEPPSNHVEPDARDSDHGSAATDHSGLDRPLAIQFIHYGFLHGSTSDRFAGSAPCRGTAMRDALIRETVLLSGFAQGARHVMIEHGQSGALGQAIATVGSLLGGSHSAPAGPAQFDPVIKQIDDAAQSININNVTYKDINAAGRKLHEAYDAYASTCASALKPGGSGGGGLPSLPSGLTIPGVPDVVKQIPGWLFKMQDAYLCMFAAIRAACEKPLMRGCHAYSLDAVKTVPAAAFDIWFDPPSADPESAGKQEDGSHGRNGEGPLGKLNELQQDAAKTKDSLTDWVVTEDETQTGPQYDALDAALAALEAEPVPHGKPSDAAAALCSGLAEGIGFKSRRLPAPLDKIGMRMAGAAVAIVRESYTTLLARRGEQDAIAHAVRDAVHRTMSGLIVAEVWHLAGLDPKGPQKNKREQANLGSIGMDSGKVLNKIADVIDKELAKQAHYVDAITDFVTSDLTGALQKAAAGSKSSEALTMETYLGRLPLALALLMRDLVFPLFNLVLKLFGLGDKLGPVWDPVARGLSAASGIANEAKATKDRVNQGAQNARTQAGKLDRDVTELKDKGVGAGTGADGGQKESAERIGALTRDAKDSPQAITGSDSNAPQGWQPPDDKPAGDTEDAPPFKGKREHGGTAQKPTPEEIRAQGFLDGQPAA